MGSQSAKRGRGTRSSRAGRGGRPAGGRSHLGSRPARSPSRPLRRPARSPCASAGRTAPTTSTPSSGYESSSYEIWHLNYDLLFGFRASDLQAVPELAAEIPTTENGGISADGKTVTVKLRQNVKWQDGQPFTAKDVAFTWNYIVDNELSAFTMYTTYVKNVQAIDDNTVQFNLEKPKANILGMWILVLPEHVWSKISPKAAENSFPTSRLRSSARAPSRPSAAKNSNQTVIMEANKDYWRGAPKIDEIIFQSYENSNNMANDLMAGGLQVAWNIPDAQFKATRRQARSESDQLRDQGLRGARLQLLHGQGLAGQPRAQGPEVPSSAQLRRQQGRDRPEGLPRASASRPRPSSSRASTPPASTGTGSPLPT